MISDFKRGTKTRFIVSTPRKTVWISLWLNLQCELRADERNERLLINEVNERIGIPDPLVDFVDEQFVHKIVHASIEWDRAKGWFKAENMFR